MHIELTSRCTLACPACSRTWFTQTLKRPFPKHDLDIEQLVKFLDCDSGRQVRRFNLEGNHGDSIYYPDFIKFIDTFRQDKNFDLVTAGSRQTRKFWEELSTRLTADDTVTFSIDGLEHNNHLYRVNSDWESIMMGLEITKRSPARVIWKTLIFSYNQNDLEQIRSLAENMGADFIPVTTHRFGNESFRPSQELVRIERTYEHSKDIYEIDPKCPSTEFISADGYYYPCCWTATAQIVAKTHFWKEREQWNIHGRKLGDLRKTVIDWAESLRQDPKKAYPICQMHCKKGQPQAWSKKVDQ